ncbi:Ribosomal RNA small subunit methyltransferase A [uncultured archaeon]|nr:Ribosomal RNA small subunit methyltransferase A [uncultured archaeon]
MTRSPKQPILYQDKLGISEKLLRFATPEQVAVYRAEKLKCEKLVEIGAGIGGQTFAFSKKCKNVLAFESNKESARILIQNLKKLQIKNVEVIIADALSVNSIDKIKRFQPDIIFCDSERPEQGERTLEKINPPIKKVLEIFFPITGKIAIEIPPFTQDIENLKENFEREFISLNQQLNRLTLYFNELKNSEVSAISLPSKEKINSENPKPKINKIYSAKKQKYLYVIDPTIQIANLIPGLAKKFNASILELNKPVLLGDEIIKSNFLTGYRIEKVCKTNQKEILKELKKIGAGKIVLRYNVKPEDYWKVRNFYENQLEGTKEISLFLNESEDEAILTEKL